MHRTDIERSVQICVSLAAVIPECTYHKLRQERTAERTSLRGTASEQSPSRVQGVIALHRRHSYSTVRYLRYEYIRRASFERGAPDLAIHWGRDQSFASIPQ